MSHRWWMVGTPTSNESLFHTFLFSLTVIIFPIQFRSIERPSIHDLLLIRTGLLSEQRCPDPVLHRHFLQLSRGDPEAFPCQPKTWSLQCCLESSSGRPLSGTSPEHPSGRCPSNLSWPLSKWRTSDSTPSSSRVIELLTLSLRERPVTLVL